LKEFELQTNNKATVYKAYLNLRAKIINSLAAEDISALSQYPYGVGNRSAFDLYTHVVTQYSQLTQDDFTTIIDQLRMAKTALQTYTALASAHRDLHAILFTAGQPLSICGALLYYCIAVDPTGYPAVTALASEQSLATANTRLAANRFLAYFNKYPDNELIFKACHMRLHQQADGSYLSRSGSRSVAGGISYQGTMTQQKLMEPFMSCQRLSLPSCHPLVKLNTSPFSSQDSTVLDSGRSSKISGTHNLLHIFLPTTNVRMESQMTPLNLNGQKA
jgi:hypothetical protein